jgi:hypothetical protein
MSRCSSPIDAEILADYWLALLPVSDEEAVEEHLFDCDSCADRLGEIAALAEGIRQLAREGSLRMIVTDAFLKRASADGVNVREYAPPPGGSVQCTVTAEDNILIGRLAANLTGAMRVDLSICDEKGAERLRLADIPFDARAGEVIYQESVTFLKNAPDNTMIARLVRVSDEGKEQLLGEYEFNHIRTLPGPGAW